LNETLRIGGVHETGVAGFARITIQLDLGRRSLTVPPPSRPPCRSRWEASTPATAALLQEARTIPIIFGIVADPIGSGFDSQSVILAWGKPP
jgi:hypothetical protein